MPKAGFAERNDPVSELSCRSAEERAKTARSGHGGDRPPSTYQKAGAEAAGDTVEARFDGRVLVGARVGVARSDAEVGARVSKHPLAVLEASRQVPAHRPETVD